MLAGSTKKFLIFICVALAIFATFSITPETHRKKLLKPIKSIYNSNSNSNSDDSNDLDSVQELSQSNKIIVKPDDAKKDYLNVEIDPNHPDQVLPVDNKNDNIDELDFTDTSVDNEKIEAILDSAPI
jgi:cell division protein FtsL